MEKFVNSLDVFNRYLEKGLNKRDFGLRGKAYEVAVRWYIQPNSKRAGTVTKANSNFGDMKKRIEGKFQNLEIKTGCGQLSEVLVIDEIMPNIDFVIWCPEINDGILPEKQGFVFSKNEFVAMLKNYAGNATRKKIATNGKTVIAIQSFYSESRPTASRKLADYFWNACYGQPTVEQWVSSDYALHSKQYYKAG